MSSRLNTGKFKTNSIDFGLWYKKLFVCKIIPRIVLDFNWRIFHGQVVTEKRLATMKLSDGTCSSCKLEVEDLTHIFVKCPSYIALWNYVSLLLKSIGIPKLEEFNMIVGFLRDDSLYDVVNTVLSMVRWIIWKRRCLIKYEKNVNETTNILYEFRYTMKNHFDTILQSRTISDNHSKNICMILKVLSA